MEETSLAPIFGGFNLALIKLEGLRELPLSAAPAELARAFTSAAAIQAAVPSRKAPLVAWGKLAALAQMIYGDYQDFSPGDADALDALRIAVEVLEAATEPDAGLKPSHQKGWALWALVGRGMLGERDRGLSDSRLPKLKMEHPATLVACGLSSERYLPVASLGAGIVAAVYRDFMTAVIELVYDAAAASATRVEELYGDVMRTALADHDATAMDIALLGCAHLSLRQLELDWRRRTGSDDN